MFYSRYQLNKLIKILLTYKNHLDYLINTVNIQHEFFIVMCFLSGGKTVKIYFFCLKFLLSSPDQTKANDFFAFSGQANEIFLPGQAKPTNFFVWSSQARKISLACRGLV